VVTTYFAERLGSASVSAVIAASLRQGWACSLHRRSLSKQGFPKPVTLTGQQTFSLTQTVVVCGIRNEICETSSYDNQPETPDTQSET